MTHSTLIQYYKTVATSILAIQLTTGIRERKREREKLEPTLQEECDDWLIASFKTK